ncbi:hypothetical protein DHEL01_v207351 [Diaporthe helianthi]|uniref:Uncharacterized protein n=1 Tax=Diaporthe helianthi TaxID=158607 RepID=A0A2P5HVK2_DIAHE|nr:hypothetical protein DHEL01_v207351 [Diaporthe helianthi]
MLQKFGGRCPSNVENSTPRPRASYLSEYKDDLQLGNLEVKARAELPPTVQPVSEIAHSR